MAAITKITIEFGNELVLGKVDAGSAASVTVVGILRDDKPEWVADVSNGDKELSGVALKVVQRAFDGALNAMTED